MTVSVTAEQVLPPTSGVAATDTANAKAAIAAVTAKGGKVLARAGTYVVNQTIVVPSGVWVEGMGEGATVFTPAAGFAGPVFEVTKGAGSRLDTVYEFAGQGFLNGLRNLSVWGGWIPSAAAINAGPILDSRQTADGIWVHDTDHTRLENVSVNWLKGYGLKVGPVVRESSFSNVQMFRCGTLSKPCLWLTNTATSDQNNTLQFDNLRIVYPHGSAINNDASGDMGARGTRLLHFIGGQIEAGGYGGALGTIQTSGAAFPGDLVYLGNCKDVYFTELELSTSGGNKLIDAASVQSLIINKCLLADAGAGQGIVMGNAEFLSVGECFGYTVGGKMVTISAQTGRAEVPASNHFIDVSTGGDAQYDSSANPGAFHGPDSGGGSGTLPTVEAPRFVGAPGQPAFSPGITNIGWGWRDTMFWKDSDGAVHIEGGVFVGAALAQAAALFVLPPGYRPSGIVGGPAQAVYVDATGTVRNNSGPLAANSYLVFAGGWVFRP